MKIPCFYFDFFNCQQFINFINQPISSSEATIDLQVMRSSLIFKQYYTNFILLHFSSCFPCKKLKHAYVYYLFCLNGDFYHNYYKDRRFQFNNAFKLYYANNFHIISSKSKKLYLIQYFISVLIDFIQLVFFHLSFLIILLFI